MILHLGSDIFVTSKSILMILAYKEAQRNNDTCIFLNGIQKKYICEKDNPKSIVVTEDDGEMTAYISPISSSTLLKRSRDGEWRSMLDPNINMTGDAEYAK